MARFAFNLLLLAGVYAFGFGQTRPVTGNKPDASALLQEISQKYSEAKYYHIEAIQEIETESDFSRSWNRLSVTAIMAPGNRYRFEVHSQFGRPLKMSDGKTETNYNADSQEYTQQPTPESGPAIPKLVIYGTEQAEVQQALEIMKDLSKTGTILYSPHYLHEEDLAMNGQEIRCYVVKGSGRYRGGSPRLTVDVTVWIDKEKHLIRKRRVRQEGPLFAGHAQDYVDNGVTLYPVMDIGIASAADTFFSFQPPAGARLVREFSDPTHPADKLAGTPAPEFKLQNANGKRVTLQDFHGKPLLLDFWATWCAPCIAAIEPLKKLHDAAAMQGLTIVSIDEDDEAEAGKKFFAEHRIPWDNFHDDGEVWRSFPGGQGIPFYVLVDANGKIVLSRSGAEDSELRAALAKVGIDVPAKNSKGEATPKQ